ncbi:acyl-CoA desaturase [Aureliella helgolandensis]|uniref:Fatty acid desaturase n=1 Tax=Aureliella helgolandensis TaxID=2527968 RepID=A0A518G3S5_9BACT|nr:acyl-CoA desaturase [Aureliella helgolandensis]QDV23247.1 Fatty acid desaturase [Aureliella helgolandensis]
MTSTGQVQWFRVAPFFLLHAACLMVFVVGWSWIAIAVAAFVYFARVFGLTAFYHRYFSHRAFKTSRAVQFMGALLGNSAAQRGPIWWAAHHRHHHRASDNPNDIHSPSQQGFIWSHMLWFMTDEGYETNHRVVKDWLKFPELRFLERFDFFAPVLLAFSMYGLGEFVRMVSPQSGTSGVQMLVWGFVVSTVALYHVTFGINSLAHTYGTRRYATGDDSRNNLWLALFTFGEGWHNNHHHFPTSARQGFLWWEIDVSYYLLVVMSWLGLVWDLKPVPNHILKRNLVDSSSQGA